MGNGFDLIAEFGQFYTVTRYGTGAYVNGLYVPGSTSTFQAMMSIQPVKGPELLKLQEGERTRNFMKGYSDTQLFTARQSPSAKADRVTFQGIVFEVQISDPWNPTDFDHWKVLLAEVNPGAKL